VSFLLDVSKTLIGAFFGAAFAFGVSAYQQRRQRQRDNKAAGNLATFVLSLHFNTLELIQREIAPHRSFPAGMPPLEHILPPLTTLDVKSLSFLIDAGEGQLIGEIAVAEDAFRTAIDALQFRNRLHIDQVQPLFEKAGFVPGASIDTIAVQRALGRRLYESLILSSQQVVELVDNAAKQTFDAGEKLNRAMRRKFPKAKVIVAFRSAGESKEVH